MTPYERRLQLLKAGFQEIVPLTGKKAVLTNWQTRGNTNPDEIKLWTTMWPAAQNTGILCRFTPVLDIDILDPEAADAIEQLVRDRFGDHGRVLPRFGKAPKRAIPFRTDKPFPRSPPR